MEFEETSLHITKDGCVFLNGVEIPWCIGFDISIEAGNTPEVVLRVSVNKIDIDEYTDFWN